jgi:EPS-associated MarR family transcriptional regulator
MRLSLLHPTNLIPFGLQALPRLKTQQPNNPKPKTQNPNKTQKSHQKTLHTPPTTHTIRVQLQNSAMPNTDHVQLRILKIIETEPEISQRQLAEVLGVSLGKTNYLIKALLEKGHIKAGNFLRAENKLKYAYLLIPEGIRAKLELTRNYLARKEQEYITMKAEIEAMRNELATLDAKPSPKDAAKEHTSNT